MRSEDQLSFSFTSLDSIYYSSLTTQLLDHLATSLNPLQDQAIFPISRRQNRHMEQQILNSNMDILVLQEKAQEIFQCQNERAKLIQRGPNLLDYTNECDRRRMKVEEAQQRHNDVIRELEAEMQTLKLQTNFAQQEWSARRNEFQNPEKTIVDKMKALGEEFAGARNDIRQRLLEHIGTINTYKDVDLFRHTRNGSRQQQLKRRLLKFINDLNAADFELISTRNFANSLRQTEQDCIEYETAAEDVRQFARKVEIESKMTVDLVKAAEAVERSLKQVFFTDEVPTAYYVVQAFLEWIETCKADAIRMMPAWIAGLESKKANRAALSPGTG